MKYIDWLSLLCLLAISKDCHASEDDFDTFIPTRCDQMRQSGSYVCSDNCVNLKRCFKTGDTWREVLVDTCDTTIGLFCNSREGKCTIQPTSCSSADVNPGFSCSGYGVYPNPYDCQKFYACYDINNRYNEITCAGNTAYNSVANDCSKSVSDAICTGAPHFVCNETVNRGVWAENPNIYYYCFTDGKITMIRCENSNQAWDRSGTSCSTTPTSNDNGQVTTVAFTSSSSSSSTSFVCPAPGLFPVTGDSYKYYFCSGSPPSAQLRSCPDGFYFNQNLKSCKRGSPFNKWIFKVPDLID